jgi:formylglycine-generating enzyme required for sulfatase activity
MITNYAVYFVLVLCLFSSAFANTAPTVSSVTASQRTDGSGVVDISYTLTDADNDKCTVSVVVSNDGGSTWMITPSSSALSGDRTNVSPGRRKISWASKVDLPGAFGSNYRVKVTANDNYVPPVPADMVYIPGGTFQMGDSFSEGDSDERPVHSVTLSPFYMGKYEITNGQYCNFLNSALSQGLITVSSNIVYKASSGTTYPYCDTYQYSTYSQINWNGSTFTVRAKSGRGMDNDPMVEVSWYGAVAYCNWRSQQEGKQACYNLTTWERDTNKKGYHLPTEAQWEYAARGGLSGKRFPWGDTINQTQANFYSYSYSYDVTKNQYHPIWNDGASPYTSPVGFFDGTMKYRANYNWPSSVTSYQTANGGNGYGLYDMAGNAWEWCNDWYGSYSSGSQTNPTGPTTGTFRVLRGGCWYGYANLCRVADRGGSDPLARDHGISGFRLSLDY